MECSEDNIEELKKKLKSYKKEAITFNEPHFTYRLFLRGADKEELIAYILNPEKLVYSYQEEGRLGDIIHCLHFKVSNNRTIRLPVIIDKGGKKGLYILSYIMRYRGWQNMVKRR